MRSTRLLMIFWSVLLLVAHLPTSVGRAETGNAPLSSSSSVQGTEEDRPLIDAFRGFSWGTERSEVQTALERLETAAEMEESFSFSFLTAEGTEMEIPARLTFIFDQEKKELCAGEISFPEIKEEALSGIRDACKDLYGEAVLSGNSEKNGLYALWIDGEGAFLFLSGLYGLQYSSGEGQYLDLISEKVKKSYYVNIDWELRKAESFGGRAGVQCACD